MLNQNTAPFAAAPPPLDILRERQDLGDFHRVNLMYPNGAGVVYQEGYSIYTEAGMVEEPNVFFIEDVEVPPRIQHQGFGTKLVELATEEARNKGFELGRCGAINPDIIGILETMAETGQVQEVAYVITRGSAIKPQMPSKEVLISDQKATPEEARAFLEALDVRNDLNDRAGRDLEGSSVVCVFRL
jgi:GNAT superfamily N-acetyltransferase